MFDYVATADSPPLAPKHIVALPNRVKKTRDSGSPMPTPPPQARQPTVRRAATAAQAMLADLDAEGESDPESSFALDRRAPAHQQQYHQPQPPQLAAPIPQKRRASPTPSDASTTSQTPSPLGPASALDSVYVPNGRKKQKAGVTYNDQMQHAPAALPMTYPGVGPQRYATEILDYFINDQPRIPDFLVNPPADFDANVIIDDDGHTALHWACAMGKLRIVKLLISAGADIFRANAEGQTALMRSVMFTNNYDLRRFPELFEILHRSTINIDKRDRSVFHCIVDIALQKGKTHAARYYLETALERLKDFPREVSDILNFQDVDGETPLTMAARARSKRLVKVLIDYGSDPKLQNREGKSAEDYIIEDERFRANTSGSGSSQPIWRSETAQKAGTVVLPQAVDLLKSLATDFDGATGEQDSELAQANAMLGEIQAEIAQTQRTLASIDQRMGELPELQAREAALIEELNRRIGMRSRLGWERYRQGEERRDAETGGRPYDEPQNPMNADALRHQLSQLQATRRDLFGVLVAKMATAGSPQRIAEFRKVLSMGLGVPLDKVDELVPSLMAEMEADWLVEGTD